MLYSPTRRRAPKFTGWPSNQTPFWLTRMEKRAAPRGYQYVFTGQVVMMTHHRVVRRAGRPVREAFQLPSRVMTLRDTRLPTAVRRAMRMWNA